MRYATTIHALVTTLVLVACLVMPRPGSATLLVPLGSRARMGAAILVMANARLLGRGRLEGSVVMQAGQSVPLWSLLRQGIVPIGVPTTLCGQAGQQ